jgi:flagellar motor switch protein FliG
MTAKPADQGIRKTAILVASLDRASADLVLDQMQAEVAQTVRQAIMDLGPIDPQEQHAIFAEFRRQRTPSQSKTSGVEVAPELAKKFAPPPLGRPPVEPPAPRPAVPPFRFLRQAEADKLVRVLATERPQTIALVLSHLPPQHAGNVLARLEAGLQVDVLRRLVDLEETDPEILRDVERGLQARLSEQVQMQRRRVAGVAAVSGILEACDQRTGAEILDNLNLYDRQLAEKFNPPNFEFEDLLGLDDRSLAATLGAADAELIQLALIGAPPAWIERFLGLIPDSQARQVRSELEHFGPTRLSDVEEARLRLATLAERLAVQGRIGRSPRAIMREGQSDFRSLEDVGSLALAKT